MGYCGVLRGTAGYCGVPWGTVGYCGVLWGTVEYCGVLWGTVGYCWVLKVLLNAELIAIHQSTATPPGRLLREWPCTGTHSTLCYRSPAVPRSTPTVPHGTILDSTRQYSTVPHSIHQYSRVPYTTHASEMPFIPVSTPEYRSFLHSTPQYPTEHPTTHSTHLRFRVPCSILRSRTVSALPYTTPAVPTPHSRTTHILPVPPQYPSSTPQQPALESSRRPAHVPLSGSIRPGPSREPLCATHASRGTSGRHEQWPLL